MAIRGNLREASLPDVLQLLALGRKTGCLSVTHRQSFGAIYFDDGRISYASIVNRRDRLGDILLKHGHITSAALERAVAAQAERPERRIGELLVETGAIESDRLRFYITQQIEEAVYHLFTWTQGTFSFEPDVRPEAQDILVSIAAESLLLEGARRIDEWSLIEKKISSLDLVFSIDRARLDAARVELTSDQKRLMPLIDGQRDVNALVDESGLAEFDVAKALFELVSASAARKALKRRFRKRGSPSTAISVWHSTRRRCSTKRSASFAAYRSSSRTTPERSSTSVSSRCSQPRLRSRVLRPPGRGARGAGRSRAIAARRCRGAIVAGGARAAARAGGRRRHARAAERGAVGQATASGGVVSLLRPRGGAARRSG
jgi:hypothetical protein